MMICLFGIVLFAVFMQSHRQDKAVPLQEDGSNKDEPFKHADNQQRHTVSLESIFPVRAETAFYSKQFDMSGELGSFAEGSYIWRHEPLLYQ